MEGGGEWMEGGGGEGGGGGGRLLRLPQRERKENEFWTLSAVMITVISAIEWSGREGMMNLKPDFSSVCLILNF